MSYYVPKGYDVFWDNGQYVAIREGRVRRNIAPYNCQTKREAIEAARQDRDDLKADGILPQNAR